MKKAIFMMLFMAVSVISFGQTKLELSQATANGDWTFTNGCSISNESGKSYSTGYDGTVKYSAGVTYTIHIPSGINIVRVLIEGYDNYDTTDAYLSVLGNMTFDANSYVFPQKTSDGTITKSYTIDLDTPATGTLAFRADGRQVCWKITLFDYAYTPGVTYITPENQMEELNRGVVVLPAKSGTGQFVSWRFLGTENFKSTTFDLLRDGAVVASDISGATCYTDAQGSTTSRYQVVTKVNGKETDVTNAVTSWGKEYLALKLNRPSSIYTPNDISVGDIDGDGQYELFVKWDPSDSKDNSQSGKTSNVYIDCYRLDGTLVWRVDLGSNIRAGAHYTQFMVYDFNGDGKAEMICKTAPGSKDGQGNYVSAAADDSNIKSTDNATAYRNSKGYILSGPEYLTVFDGKTGTAIHTIWYNPNRGGTFNATASYPSSSNFWGDSYANRSERYLACVAYLDGPSSNPSVVMCRGYYTRAYVWAVDFNGSKLVHKWLHASVSNSSVEHYDANWNKTTKTYSSNTSGKGSLYTLYGNGNHNLSVGDVDGDGCDEIIWGSGAVDNDGQLLYSVGYGHGDAIHLADFDPDRFGLELFDVHEENVNPYGGDLHDAATGEVLYSFTASGDTGRGMAADVDADNRGGEFWSSASGDVRAVDGTTISTSRPSQCMRIYWDGDLQDELFDGHYDSSTGKCSPAVEKWNTSKKKASTYKSFTDIGNSQTCNTTKATPNLIADLFGDWREEIIMWDYSDGCTINIFSTNEETEYRIPTLMHDHVYRMGIAWQNVAYNQPAHVGYYPPAYVEYLATTKPLEDNSEEMETVTGTITLPFYDGNTDFAIIYANEVKGKVTASVTLGNALGCSGKRYVNGAPFNEISTTEANASSGSDANALTIRITTTVENATFRPTAISFNACKIGTNGGTFDLALDGKSLYANEAPNRNNEANGYYSSYNKTLSSKDGTEHEFVFNLYNYNYDKVFGLGSIVITGELTAPVSILIGDVNRDGLVNVTDVVCLVNYILTSDASNIDLEAADVNGDGSINITDTVALTNLILSMD
ncbi:MAG: rhamnogalacturonan lyase [Prevotella sp.]|nr:rhamnogalacturonan lyase [Prevotella sp.]